MKACENRDWSKAYEILDRYKKNMENAYTRYQESKGILYDGADERAEYYRENSNYLDARKYIVVQECVYLLESDGISALPRIHMVMKEHDCDYYDDIIEIAITMNNPDLVQQLYINAGGDERNVPETLRKKLKNLGIIEVKSE